MKTSQLLASAYLVIILLLGLALWNPLIPGGPAAIDLMLVSDESASIDPVHRARIWSDFRRWTEALPSGSRVAMLRFAERARIELPWTDSQSGLLENALLSSPSPPLARHLGGRSTDLAGALNFATTLVSPARRSAIVISSDGLDSENPKRESPPLRNANPLLSLYLARAPGSRARQRLAFASIDLPGQYHAGQVLPIAVSLVSRAGGEGLLQVSERQMPLAAEQVAIPPGGRQAVYLEIPGTERFERQLEFVLQDAHGGIIDQRRAYSFLMGERQLLVISGRQDLPGWARAEGWRTTWSHPSELAQQDNFFESYNVVVLDDLPASDLTEPQLVGLERAIRQQAVSLIVLGGMHSFADGGYRHSALENLLPVLAEAARPEGGAAFVFVLDKSGSMDASSQGASRLSYALAAVEESFHSLRAGDEIALLAFDREVETLLPLDRYADIAGLVERPWQIAASGGTRLAPALASAIEVLNDSRAQDRHLFVISDGFVEAGGIDELQQALVDNRIRLNALLVGEDANVETLGNLARSSGGQVLRIAHSAQLPRILRRKVEQQQHNRVDQQTEVLTSADLPFLADSMPRWQPLEGYQVTRPRATAKQYLSSSRGDPLLASWQLGAGRVAVLPGGVLADERGRGIMIPLMHWLDSRQDNPQIEARHDLRGNELHIDVDVRDVHGGWVQSAAARATIVSPSGEVIDMPMQAVAPGRYHLVLTDAPVGRYRLRIDIAGQQALYRLQTGSRREQETGAPPPWLETALRARAIQPWHAAALDELIASSRAQVSSRPWWLLLAVALYLALLIYERRQAVSSLWPHLQSRIAEWSKTP